MRILRALVLVPVFAFACSKEPTEISFIVTTDLDCAKIKDTAVSVGGTGDVEKKPAATVSTICTNGKLGTLVVVPSGDDNAEVAVRVVSGVDKSADRCASEGLTGGCIVARRSLRYIAHTSLRVPISMRASCIDVSCNDTSELSTCVKGKCVPARIADSNQCTSNGCDEDTLAGPSSTTDGGGVDAPSDASADARIATGDGEWRPIASTTLVNGRAYASVVWTGTQMIVYGGDIGPDGYARNGLAYDPIGNTWDDIGTFDDIETYDHTGVWTGEEMIVWGGRDSSTEKATGGAWNPGTKQWRTLPAPTFAFGGRFDAATAWTGSEMIIWGGHTVADVPLGDGAAYNPSSNTWRQLASSPLTARYEATAFWDGKKVHIVGGEDDSGPTADGATWDPMTNSWSTLASPGITPRGDMLAFALERPGAPSLGLFFGGRDVIGDDTYFADGTLLDPTNGPNGGWTPIAAPPATVLPDPTRIEPFTWYALGRLWMWGGASPALEDAKGDGASYDLATKEWKAMPPGGPSPRIGGAAVWTGDRVIVWGGIRYDASANETKFPDGMIFVPK